MHAYRCDEIKYGNDQSSGKIMLPVYVSDGKCLSNFDPGGSVDRFTYNMYRKVMQLAPVFHTRCEKASHVAALSRIAAE